MLKVCRTASANSGGDEFDRGPVQAGRSVEQGQCYGMGPTGAACHQGRKPARAERGTATGFRRPSPGARTRAGRVRRMPCADGGDAGRTAGGCGRRIETDGVARYRGPRHPLARQPTLIVPRITDQWPGKLQKNSYGPSPLIALAGKVTEVVPPPPTSSVWAITRGSSAGT